MPAYFDTGFSVRQPMWHGEGSVLDDYPETWDDARVAAGLMWEPAYRSVYGDPMTITAADVATMSPPSTDGSQIMPSGIVVRLVHENDDGSGLVLPIIDGFRRIVRDDTGDTLAVPTDSFELIYHSQMGELIEAYTEAWRKAGAAVKFETAGALKGGRVVWALVYLDEPYTVPGDESPTYPFAAIMNPHDGSGAAKLLPTDVRIVCWNTYNAASMRGDMSGHQVVIRHVGNVGERIEQAKESLAVMRDESKAWQMMATDLAAINVDDAFVRTFAEEFIPTPENATERTINARAERRSLFLKLHDESPTMDGIRGTAYGVVQAAGEYLDHLRPFRSRDTYLTRTMLRPEPIKANVLDKVRELVDAGTN